MRTRLAAVLVARTTLVVRVVRLVGHAVARRLDHDRTAEREVA